MTSGVPLSFVYKDDTIYFHCAVAGQQLDNIANNSKVSLCVVVITNALPDKFVTEYESAVVFGSASEVHDAERQKALEWLLEKYCSEAGRSACPDVYSSSDFRHLSTLLHLGHFNRHAP